MIHSCTSISIKDDEKTVAEGDDERDVGAVQNDGNEEARERVGRGPDHSKS